MARSLNRPARGAGVVWRLSTALALVLALVAAVLAPAPARAAPGDPTGSNLGTDFWLAFPERATVGAGTPTLTLTLAGAAGTTGTVVAPGLAPPFSQSFAIGGDGTAVVTVPESANVTGNDVVSAQGVRVTAAAPVAAYCLADFPHSSDGFLALPVAALGTEYRVLTYAPSSDLNFFIDSSSQFVLVGTAAGTTATITPSVTVGTHAAGTPFAVSLGAGQTYRLASQTGDLSGTRVAADRPLAVFGGVTVAQIPVDAASGEYLVEQLPPVSAWRSDFLFVPFPRQIVGDYVRILAAEGGTVVSIDGTPVATLAAGQFHEALLAAPARIAATKPVLVAQFARGSVPGSGEPDYLGDPSMALVPALAQYRSAYTFRPHPTDYFSAHTADLIAPAAAVGQITLDGAAIPAGQYTAIGATGYAYARVAVAAGAGHTLAGPQPFGATLVGIGYANAYSYPLGLGLTSATALSQVRGNASYGDATATLTATLTTAGGSPVAGATVAFTLGGIAVGSATTNAQGVATLGGVALPAGTNAGTYANRVCATFAGDANYLPTGPTCGPLVVARRALTVKPTDRTVGLKQPNPPTTPPVGCVQQQTATSACWLELTNSSTFVNGDDWSDLNLTQLRFQYSRNPASTNASEQVGSVYRITALGATSANYELRYQPGTLTVK